MTGRVVMLAALACGLALAGPVDWQARANGLDIEVRVPAVAVGPAVTDGYSSVVLDGAGYIDAIGTPMVPVYRELIEVPYGAEVVLETEAAGVETERLELPLLPRQAPVPKSGPLPGFALDEKAYSRDEFGPESGARIAADVISRGHRLVLVEVFPVSYNPVRQELRVARDLVVRVRWIGADYGRTAERQERYDSPVFEHRLRGVVLNEGQFDTDPPGLPVGYLIIVPDAWEANVRPLAEWRRRKGYNVFVRNLTQVGGGSASQVKAFLQDAYDNWPIPPSIVLLVGDVDRIGSFVGQGAGSPDTDLDFSLLEGSDYLPDIDLARASLASAAQLDSFIANVVTYEQVGGTGGEEWLNKAYFIASSDGGNHQVAEATHRYVMQKLRGLGVECDSLWLYYSQGTPIVTAINTGRSWVTYSGHGSTTSWADCNFTVSNVHDLANTDLVPYVQTYACQSGDFTVGECFSESWIRNGRRGGIAHIASSVNSYWEEDDTLERRVFDCTFDSGYHWIMGGYNKAKLIFFQQMGNNSTTRRYLEMYNMIGDGAVDVFASEPVGLSVTYPLVIPLGAYPLGVTVSTAKGSVEDALVCATGKSDTTVFASGYTDAAGQVTLNILTTAPDTVYVTVTGHNLEPHLGMTMALPSSGPYVLYLRSTVDDSAGGNNDGIVNPGETINLPTWVKNWGSGTANGVESRLRTADANITLLDTVKSFGTIGAGDSAYTGPDGFGFSVAASCTNGYALRFTVRTRDANDSVWEAPLNLTVGAPVLEYVDWLASDPPPGGNNNGMIEPGETGDLMVTLLNSGQGHAYGVTATLRSGDARLSVLDSLGSWGTILRDSTGRNSGDRFRVQADPGIPRETRVPCTLAIAVGGAEYVRVFELGIGEIRACDPIPDGPRAPALYYAYDSGDSLYTQAPRFEWVEISGVGTRLTLSDDQTVQVSLGAFGPWRFYGQDFSQVSICGNGFVAPGSHTYSSYSNTALPQSSAPGMVCLNWDDLYPPTGGGVWWFHDAPNHRFIVEWDSVHYYSPREDWDKYQLVLYDTTVATPSGDNAFTVQYLTANRASSSTVGLQNPGHDVCIQYLFDGDYHRGAAVMAPGMAIRYTTDPPNVGVVEEGPGGAGFSRLVLLPCAPNPARNGSRFRFQVGVETRVRLAVYDASGRRVARLFDGKARPGSHTVTWDGRDDSGRRTARGVYLYRLETAQGSLARKLVVVD